MILATDMSRGHEDLVMLNSLIEDHNVINGMNAEELIDTSSKVNQFKSQQFLLETTVHAGDMSVATRKFESVQQWTYLLFEEFFNQGDVEKHEGLPVTFLCDRNQDKTIPDC